MTGSGIEGDITGMLLDKLVQVVKIKRGRNLMRRLREHEDTVLAFVVEGVPFTDDWTERGLRPAKSSRTFCPLAGLPKVMPL